MSVNYSILGAIRKNPLYMIYKKSGRSKRYVLKFLSNEIKSGSWEIYTAEEPIDIINERDIFIREWYGIDTYNEIQKMYSEESVFLKTLKAVGFFHIDDHGNVFGKNLKPIKINSNKVIIQIGKAANRVKIKLTVSDMLNMYNGFGIVGRIDYSFFYIAGVDGDFILSDTPLDGVKYIKREDHFYSKKSPTGVFVKEINGKTYSEARLKVDNKNYYLSTFSMEEAKMAHLDMYYLFRGYLHPEDNRKIVLNGDN